MTYTNSLNIKENGVVFYDDGVFSGIEGTAGNVLTSNGPGQPPAYAPVGGGFGGTVTTANNTPTTLVSIPLVPGDVCTITGIIVALSPDDGIEYALGGDFMGSAQNVGNGVVVIGSPFIRSNTTLPGLTYTIAASGNNMIVQVTGDPEITFDWQCSYQRTILSGGGQAMLWSDQATNFTAARSNGYFLTGALTATLPASPIEGDEIAFFCIASSGCVIQANAGQTIRLTTGVSSTAGSATQNAQGDSLTLVYSASNTQWSATDATGTWTLA